MHFAGKQIVDVISRGPIARFFWHATSIANNCKEADPNESCKNKVYTMNLQKTFSNMLQYRLYNVPSLANFMEMIFHPKLANESLASFIRHGAKSDIP